MGENYFGLTDPGRMRTNNEDRFIAQPVLNEELIIACVIDGVGGYTGGEIAAELTREEIIGHLKQLPTDIIQHMAGALQDANERIIKEKEVNPQYEKMACVVTLAVVNINKNSFYYAHVGDTRLYLFRDGSLIKVTKDHSTVGFLEESGRLSEEAAMQHPKRNEVNKALGYEPQIVLTKDFIDTGESPFLPGDIILMCSDGLTDMVPASKIISVLKNEKPLPQKAEALIAAANEAGGKDNVTVVLVCNDKSPVQHPVTKPVVTIKKNITNGDGELKPEKDDIQQFPLTEKTKPGKGINQWVILFGIISFLGFAWLVFENYSIKKLPEKPVPILHRQRSKQEIDLLDSINSPGNKMVILNGSQPIFLTNAIEIKNDSLHIRANGISFVRDSAYTGPAFILSPSCKNILLDSISVENFDVGILVMNKGLHLKNVRFKNCLVPLQFQLPVNKDSLISGVQADPIFNVSDSMKR